MFFYIDPSTPGKITVSPAARRKPHHYSLTYEYNEVKGRFIMAQSTYNITHEQIKQNLGIRVWHDGFFISDKEMMFFLLKYSNLPGEITVDFPLIPMYNTNTEETE